MNNPAIEPVARTLRRAAISAPALHLLAGPRGPLPGLPLMRALWLHYPGDAKARQPGDEYLWGRDLLVAPVYPRVRPARDVYLPDGRLVRLVDVARTAGGRVVSREVDLATMPIYVRAGASCRSTRCGRTPVKPSPSLRRCGSIPAPTGGDPVRRRRHQSGVPGRQGQLDRHEVERPVRGSSRLAPGAPPGATNVVSERTFKVVMQPEGTSKHVTYAGRRVQAAAVERA